MDEVECETLDVEFPVGALSHAEKLLACVCGELLVDLVRTRSITDKAACARGPEMLARLFQQFGARTRPGEREPGLDVGLRFIHADRHREFSGNEGRPVDADRNLRNRTAGRFFLERANTLGWNAVLGNAYPGTVGSPSRDSDYLVLVVHFEGAIERVKSCHVRAFIG